MSACHRKVPLKESKFCTRLFKKIFIIKVRKPNPQVFFQTQINKQWIPCFWFKMCFAFCNRICKNGIPNSETCKNTSSENTKEDGPHILHINEDHLKKKTAGNWDKTDPWRNCWVRIDLVTYSAENSKLILMQDYFKYIYKYIQIHNTKDLPT